MVSGVVSEYPVKLNIINFVCGLSLESLVNEVELTLGDYYFHVVKDRSESGVGNEPTVALVLILEEWLDQESSVSDVSSNSSEAGLEVSLLRLAKLVLWIKDGWGLEGTQCFSWVFLKIFLCEDAFDLLVESHVVDLGWISWASEVILKKFVFLSGQL